MARLLQVVKIRQVLHQHLVKLQLYKLVPLKEILLEEPLVVALEELLLQRILLRRILTLLHFGHSIHHLSFDEG